VPNCVPPLIADRNLRSQKAKLENCLKAGFFSTLFYLDSPGWILIKPF
jgi:hypothetical protein